MTYKEKFNNETNWKRKVFIVELFHCHMLLKFGKKWKLKRTAIYFQKSISLISEDIKIAKFLTDNHHLNGSLTSRNEALKLMRKK